MAEMDINRACIIAQDATGKLYVIDVEDIPADEDPFTDVATGPSQESVDRARSLWEKYRRLQAQSGEDAA